MLDDVILNKVTTIERCLARIQDFYANNDKNLFEDVTRQDSIILNIQPRTGSWARKSCASYSCA